MLQEASGCQNDFQARTFSTVYIGGGTPTVLAPQRLDRLIGHIKKHFRITADAEFTVEANPNSLFSDHLAVLENHAVNRLSLGVQSFSDDILRSLGRLHSAKQALDSFHKARDAGFGNIGIDLIYGMPGLSLDEWDKTLKTTIDLKPEHVSVYSLSLDQGSRFKQDADAGIFELPDDDIVADQYELALRKLSGAGYVQYEISNFSLPGFVCRHNSNYWERGEYLGLGAGAWSFIRGRRYHNVADVDKYCRRLKSGLTVIDDGECVDVRQAANEAIMLGLRTSRGIDIAEFQREFGRDKFALLKEKIDHANFAGLIREADGWISLSKTGFLLADQVLERLIL